MEAKTALELWNDGVEGRLNLQLYHCDVDKLLQEGQGTSLFGLESEEFPGNMLPETRMSPFLYLDPSSEEEASEDFISEGRVTPPLRLFDHLDSPTYEELFEQNWQLFEGLDQEHESSKDVHEDLDSPKVICSVLPEPTCLTKIIQSMVMYPPTKKAPKKKKIIWGRQKRRRPPRKTGIMVSNGENDDGVESGVRHPSGGVIGWNGFHDQETSRPLEQPVAESSSSVQKQDAPLESPLGTSTGPEMVEDPMGEPVIGWNGFEQTCRPEQLLGDLSSMRKQDIPWESPLGTPTSPEIFLAPPITALEEIPSFDEHLARCAVDWDYPRVLFAIGGYDPEPSYQELISSPEMVASPGSNLSFTVPVQPPLTPLALEQNFMPALGASNGVSSKKRYASTSLSTDSERLRGYSRDIIGPENVEPITKLTPRLIKRRRLVT